MVMIRKMTLNVATKQMSDATKLDYRALVCERIMRLPYICVMMKHVAIYSGSSIMCLDNIFPGGLFDLIMMVFVSNTTIAGSYTENTYNLRTSISSELIFFVTACECRGLATNRTSLRRYITPII